MAFVLASQITLGNYVLKEHNGVTIKKSIHEPVGTAEILLPRNTEFEGRQVSEILKTGDEVSIALGYNEEIDVVFNGYLSRSPEANIPLKLYCEDEMYQLKKGSFDESFNKAKLQTIIDTLAPNYTNDVADVTLDKLLVDSASALKVFHELKSQLGLYTYFKNGVLHCGLAYPNQYNEHTYHMQKNVAATNLKYRKAEDVVLLVKAISKNSDGSTLNAEYGDQNGSVRTVHYYNLSQTELTEKAKEVHGEFQFDGYAGSITGFGQPIIDIGDHLTIEDDLFPERSSTNLVDAVTITHGVNGYRYECELGKRVA